MDLPSKKRNESDTCAWTPNDQRQILASRKENDLEPGGGANQGISTFSPPPFFIPRPAHRTDRLGDDRKQTGGRPTRGASLPPRAPDARKGQPKKARGGSGQVPLPQGDGRAPQWRQKQAAGAQAKQSERREAPTGRARVGDRELFVFQPPSFPPGQTPWLPYRTTDLGHWKTKATKKERRQLGPGFSESSAPPPSTLAQT